MLCRPGARSYHLLEQRKKLPAPVLHPCFQSKFRMEGKGKPQGPPTILAGPGLSLPTIIFHLNKYILLVYDMALVIKKFFCEEVNGRCIAIDLVTTKMSASVLSIRDFSLVKLVGKFLHNGLFTSIKNTLVNSWKHKSVQRKNISNVIKSFLD